MEYGNGKLIIEIEKDNKNHMRGELRGDVANDSLTLVLQNISSEN